MLLFAHTKTLAKWTKDNRDWGEKYHGDNNAKGKKGTNENFIFSEMVWDSDKRRMRQEEEKKSGWHSGSMWSSKQQQARAKHKTEKKMRERWRVIYWLCFFMLMPTPSISAKSEVHKSDTRPAKQRVKTTDSCTEMVVWDFFHCVVLGFKWWCTESLFIVTAG